MAPQVKLETATAKNIQVVQSKLILSAWREAPRRCPSLSISHQPLHSLVVRITPTTTPRMQADQTPSNLSSATTKSDH